LVNVIYLCGVKIVNAMLQAASNIADAYAEPHPLWEYPARPLSATFDLLHVNLGKSLHGIKSLERSGSVELTRSVHCHFSVSVQLTGTGHWFLSLLRSAVT